MPGSSDNAMSILLRDLGRNLAAGALLVLGQPVPRLRFRIGVPQLLALFVVSAVLDIAVDWLRQEPGASFAVTGLVSECFFGALLMLFAAVLALAFRQPGYALALPVIVLSGEWPLQLARMMISVVARQDIPLAAGAVRAEQIVLLWTLFWLWRSAGVALAPGQPRFWPRSLAAGVLLATPLWFGPALLGDEAWWQSGQQAIERDAKSPSAASEQVLAAQPQLLYDALTELEDERPGQIDLYFVGFAPYAGEDVFRKDIEVARELFDDRFDTVGRSVVLINNPKTVLEKPLATVSNLRLTLAEIGQAIDRDDDVVMLYLTSHGSSDHRLTIDFPPLELEQLSPAALRKILDDSGIKWRIIVVSACYSGGFIEPLKDENTLVITAAAADRTSFGCGSASEATYFGDALFQHALRFEDSFIKAFEQARERIAARERAEHRSPPSNPQLSVGSAMEEKLKKLEGALRTRRSSATI